MQKESEVGHGVVDFLQISLCPVKSLIGILPLHFDWFVGFDAVCHGVCGRNQSEVRV